MSLDKSLCESTMHAEPDLPRGNWDIIVIGAGPAGSVAARQLAVAGKRVLLVERKRLPRRKVCGGCVSETAVALLRQVGMGDALDRLPSVALREFKLRGAAGELSVPMRGGLAIPRAALDMSLAIAAQDAGAVLVTGVRGSVGPCEGQQRTVQLACDSAGDHGHDESPGEQIRASLVLVADGLGHPSLHRCDGFRSVVDEDAYVGAASEVTEFPAYFQPGTVHMAIGRAGYVGLVQWHGGQLNAAAALSPEFVREQRGLGPAAASIVHESGWPEIPALRDADWRGTPTMTRQSEKLAGERLFLLGDAAGYLEPFTGEGIGWAIAAGIAIGPLAEQACQTWSNHLIPAWNKTYMRTVRQRQQICWLLTGVLRRPKLSSILLRTFSTCPVLARPIMRRLSTTMRKVAP